MAGESVKISVSYLAVEEGRRYTDRTMTLPAGSTVSGLLEHLGLDLSQAGVVSINGHSANLDQTLQAGDKATLIPMIMGG